MRYFRRGGDSIGRNPLLVFYFAVGLYETGDRAGGAAALKRALPQIQPTEYVELYVAKILGTSASPAQKP